LVRVGVALDAEHLGLIAEHGYSRLVLLDADETHSLEMIQPGARAEILRAVAEAISFLRDCGASSATLNPALSATRRMA
jgi:hypothetical protein